MININFRECCVDCVNLDIYTNSNNMYGEDKVIYRYTDVGCNHEKVCKEYRESDINEKIRIL